MAGVVAGVFSELIGKASLPNWAKGFGLPSFPSGVSTILESRRLLKATSDKTELSNFILLTLNSKLRKSSAVIEVAPRAPATEPPLPGSDEGAGDEETRLACSPDDLTKKI